MNDFLNIQDQDFTFMGRESRCQGLFHFKGHTHISSHLEGEIEMGEEAQLTLEKESKVVGKIKCQDIKIYGAFEGILDSNGKVTVYSSAIIEGEINAKNLIIHPGARLNMDGHTSD